MALKLKYTDEHGIVHINMSPKSSPRDAIEDPQFDTINHRFGQYDLFGQQYEEVQESEYTLSGDHTKQHKNKQQSKFEHKPKDMKHNLFDQERKIDHKQKEVSKDYNLFGQERKLDHRQKNLFESDYRFAGQSGDGSDSLFRSRYNSIEEELANTPYAFATDRSLRTNALDITIDRSAISPSKDIEDDRFFRRKLSLEFEDVFKTSVESPAFTVTQLIHAQDRYFDLSTRFDGKQDAVDGRTRCEVNSFQVLNCDGDVKPRVTCSAPCPVVPNPKRNNEKSFAILTETSSRPGSPKSLPADLYLRPERVSPFKGRGFREETSRHTTPQTSAANSRNNSPPRRRTNSLSRIDKMATATLPPPITLPRPHSPRDFVRQNMEEVREISELNRERHAAEAERMRKEEEDALEREMELQEKVSRSLANSRVGSTANSRSNSRINSRSNSRVNSRNNSRTNSRSNSPSKKVQSRPSSPTTITKANAAKSTKPGLVKPTSVKKTSVKPMATKDPKTKPAIFINKHDGMAKPVAHRSRLTTRSVSKSQPQSNVGSPKHSKIPKRQSSVSPVRTTGKRVSYISNRPIENSMHNDRRYMSSSTSSIHEIIKVGSQIHDKRFASQSSQNLSISPKHIKGKPPISPGRGGPPPSNQRINAKRLSPIVGTPNKSPVEDLKPAIKSSLKSAAKKPGTTPVASKVNSRQPSRAASREPSPDKRKITAKTPVTKPSTVNKPISRTPSNKSLSKPTSSKVEAKGSKTISRTDSMKSLTRAPSNLTSKPPLKKVGSKASLMGKSPSTTKIDEAGKKDVKTSVAEKEVKIKKQTTDTATDPDKNMQQDNETQYDKITNEKGELVIMTKKSIMSMTTAAITSQPLELVTTVTNQLPNTLEKAREKGIFERLSSKDSLTGKDDGHKKDPEVKIVEEKKKEEVKRKPIFTEDHKLKPIQGPFNDPLLEKVRLKIDDILKTPEISRENILTASAKFRAKAKNDVKELKEKEQENEKMEQEKEKETEKKKPEEKVETEKPVKTKEPEPKVAAIKPSDAITKIRTEATKIVDSIITPVEEPKPEPPKVAKASSEVKKTIDPIVKVVNEKKGDVKVNEALVKGEPEVEVQSSNVSTPRVEKMHLDSKMENGSEKSQSNGGFPQSTSTTPKPPVRTKKEQKEKQIEPDNEINATENEDKRPNICSRLMGKCKSKCCPCCIKGEGEMQDEVVDLTEKKQGMMSKFGLGRKKVEEQAEREIERAAGKGATIEFEDETRRKRKFRDVMCCGRRRRVADAGVPAQNVADVTLSPRDLSMSNSVVNEAGCCGRKRQVERRDSILSDRPPASCCNNRVCSWMRGMCRRKVEPPTSRRASMFSKNKSLSPTLPPEDTRKKLDPSLVEHTSLIRAAVPVLPGVLAYFCLVCNVLVPGLGSIFSGMFCLCFGIPRFGVHDGAKYRIGSFVVNLLVGFLQLFTVLFCLVGWGWSIWWGVIMVKVSRKYRKLKAEAQAAEAAEAQAPPVTANNHRA